MLRFMYEFNMKYRMLSQNVCLIYKIWVNKLKG